MPSLTSSDNRRLRESFVYEVKSASVLAAMTDMPNIFNQEYNRAMKSIGGKFTRYFNDRTPLVVRRKTAGKSGGSAGSNVFVPKRLKAIGFSAKIRNFERLEGKFMRVGTRNPVMISQETGRPDPIRPRRGKYLLVRVTTTAGRAAVARGAPRGTKTAIRRRTLPFAILVPQVKNEPRLQFLKSWRSFQPQASRGMREATSRAVRRVSQIRHRQADRRAQSFARAIGRLTS